MNLEALQTEIISNWCPLADEELEMVSELASLGLSADKICLVLQRKRNYSCVISEWKALILIQPTIVGF